MLGSSRMDDGLHGRIMRLQQRPRDHLDNAISAYDFFIKGYDDLTNSTGVAHENYIHGTFRYNDEDSNIRPVRRVDSKPTAIVDQAVANLVSLIFPKGLDSLKVHIDSSITEALSSSTQKTMIANMEDLLTNKFIEALSTETNGILEALRDSVSNYLQYGFTLASFEDNFMEDVEFFSYHPYLTYFERDVANRLKGALGGVMKWNYDKNRNTYHYRYFEPDKDGNRVYKITSDTKFINSSAKIELLGTSKIQNYFVATKGSRDLPYGDGDGLQSLPHIYTCNKLQGHLLYACEMIMYPPLAISAEANPRMGRADGKEKGYNLRPNGVTTVSVGVGGERDLSTMVRTIIDPNSYNFEAISALYQNSVLAIQTAFSEEALSQLNKYSTATEVASENARSVNQIQGKILNLNKYLLEPMMNQVFKVMFSTGMFTRTLLSQAEEMQGVFADSIPDIGLNNLRVSIQGFAHVQTESAKAEELGRAVQIHGALAEVRGAEANAKSAEEQVGSDDSLDRLSKKADALL